MDTLSSLFSKNFKRDPKLLQFHGINEDLYEGKKLISKRRRTKNKIAKKSSLLEGFGNQLDNLALNEDQQTVDLNRVLQKNLSSYATSLKTTISDYVNARREERLCRADCENLKAITPQCNNEDVTGCTTCESCYAQGPGFWCPETGQCSTYGNPCTSSCNDVCTADNVETCTTCQSCYAQGPGYWCSDTGTCSTNGNPCTGGCGQGGLQTSSHINQLKTKTDKTETTNKKQSCLAGCGLSKAYLEATEPIGRFNNADANINQPVNDCAELAPPPIECNDCAYGRSDFWGGYGWGSLYNFFGYNFLEPTWWRQETCAEMDGGTGCCQWVPNEEICTGWGCGEGYCAQVKDVWCPGGRGEDANPPCNDSAEGQMRLAACNSSFASNAEAINQANDGRNLTQEYSNLNNEYLSSDQCNEQDVTGCSNCESCYAQGPGFWCADTQTCSTYGNPCTGNCSNQCTAGNVEGCTTCETCYAQGPGFWCSDTGRCSTYGNPCTGGCGGGGYQGASESGNVLLADARPIDARITSILDQRQALNTANIDTKQNLTNMLNNYKYQWSKLLKNEQDAATLTAMTEDGQLKRNSANLKYYIWLGLAICGLIIAIRKLKK